MKAILIDPRSKTVQGIEVEYTTLSQAFTNGRSTPVALTMLQVKEGMLITNQKSWSAGWWFCLLGSGLKPIYGKALVLGYARDGQGIRSTPLTVREVEEVVRFGS